MSTPPHPDHPSSPAPILLLLLPFLLGSCGSDDGPTGEPLAPVPDPVPAVVTVTPEAVQVDEGATASLEATVEAADGTVLALEVDWSSDDTTVATVDGSGRVTGMASGATVISASVQGVEGVSRVGVVFPVDARHGQTYRAIRVGSHAWLTESLDVGVFRTGDSIPRAVEAEAWVAAAEAGEPAWSYYENDSTSAAGYGRLYNRHVVTDPRGVCPEGWHLPSDGEWTELTVTLGLDPALADEVGVLGSAVGGKMKSVRTSPDPGPAWDPPNVGATNESGFTGLPAGYRDEDGSFQRRGAEGGYWSTTPGTWEDGPGLWGRGLLTRTGGVYRNTAGDHGFSIRCVED